MTRRPVGRQDKTHSFLSISVYLFCNLQRLFPVFITDGRIVCVPFLVTLSADSPMENRPTLAGDRKKWEAGAPLVEPPLAQQTLEQTCFTTIGGFPKTARLTQRERERKKTNPAPINPLREPWRSHPLSLSLHLSPQSKQLARFFRLAAWTRTLPGRCGG